MEDKIKQILTRGVSEIIDGKALEKKLASGKKLRVKFGTDPTSPNIHLGRSVPILKLRDFQQAGHQIVLIVGDFTGQIGDTSDKDAERPMLSEEKIQENLKSYWDQFGKIVDLEKCEKYYNSEWLSKLTYKEIATQADIFSLAEFNARENIKKRLDAGKRISLRETLYPLMQGYDSVAIKADVEIGGTDQRFNLLTGRNMQEQYGQARQDIIMNEIIEGLDGRKMSSSWGNTVNLFDAPKDMYGKIMSLKDEYIVKYFIMVTRVDLAEVAEYEKALKSGVNPREIKMKLAYEITKFYHDEKAAEEAQNHFVKVISNAGTPDEIAEFAGAGQSLLEVLVASQMCGSKSDARRVLEQKGVKVNDEVCTDGARILEKNDVVRKGKLNFIKIA